MDIKNIEKAFLENSGDISNGTFMMKTEITGFRYADVNALKDFINNMNLSLKRDPENAYDTKAVKVLNANGVKIGWIPRYKNEVVANLLDGGKTIEVRPALFDADFDEIVKNSKEISINFLNSFFEDFKIKLFLID